MSGVMKWLKNSTLEDLKKDKKFAGVPEKIIEILYYSAKRADEYEVRREIPKEPNALKLAKWYREEIEEFCAEIDKVEELCGVRCSCEKGCAACCRQLIVISSTEVLVIQNEIDNLSKEQKKDLKRKVLEQCEKLENAGISEQEINSYVVNEELLQSKYFKLGLDCPFLNEEKLCSIYSVRPFNCWTYRNYGAKILCENNAFVSEAIKFDDWEHLGIERMFQARKPKNNLRILQVAIKEYLNNF